MQTKLPISMMIISKATNLFSQDQRPRKRVTLIGRNCLSLISYLQTNNPKTYQLFKIISQCVKLSIRLKMKSIFWNVSTIRKTE